ncbi:sarcoplasmic/endoplasmic reticulum calcium ATPase regulator DWORF isoform X1 [Camelus ferus]|uniref:Sarcoplasmic/endoplasmic reticulum calcium ATPase regulator DWORF isoform X1 n=1 Tax=Camelus ferus TaxID=419612 RepID=A0A8B8THP2_CAMFR|nr:sarcoplasmic/endoplasmic reticulum calcium ATPase regulator DWORF isoform X1 [Camelus ferus]
MFTRIPVSPLIQDLLLSTLAGRDQPTDRERDRGVLLSSTLHHPDNWQPGDGSCHSSDIYLKFKETLDNNNRGKRGPDQPTQQHKEWLKKQSPHSHTSWSPFFS